MQIELKRDVIIVGGGLSGCLIAWRLSLLRPHHKVVLIEQNANLAGEHTWSFHGPDLSDTERQWVLPIVDASWTHQEVYFAQAHRAMNTSYHSLRSATLERVVRRALSDDSIIHDLVIGWNAGSVLLASGRLISAPLIIDARGIERRIFRHAGFQKFFGLDITLQEPHGLHYPIVMDARVRQDDGYRFFYLLPWSSRRILIEDTRYSTNSCQDELASAQDIHAYIEQKGWKIDSIDREERGVLPIPREHFELDVSPHSVAVGVRAGLFHYVTGYSIPWAVATADQIAGLPELTTQAAQSALSRLAEQKMKDRNFWLVLNRMIFQGAQNDQERLAIFSQFYKRDASFIERFYRGELSFLDRAKIFTGRPPIRVDRAWRNAFSRGAL